jgi:anti-sigma factor RsiW
MHDVNTHLTDEQLSTYLDNRLDAPEGEAAHGHLHVCAECNRSLQELTYTVQALREMAVPPLPRSFQIVEEPKTSFWARLFGSGIAIQGLAAAAAGLFVVLLSADLASLTSPAGIVPLAPAAQPKAVAPADSAQPTMLPYNPPAAAGRTSASAPGAAGRTSASAPAPAAPAPGTPAPTAQAAGAPAQDVARATTVVAEQRAREVSDSARLEALTAVDGSAATAARAVPRLSLATLVAGLVAVLLIITAVVRTVRKA